MHKNSNSYKPDSRSALFFRCLLSCFLSLPCFKNKKFAVRKIHKLLLHWCKHQHSHWNVWKHSKCVCTNCNHENIMMNNIESFRWFRSLLFHPLLLRYEFCLSCKNTQFCWSLALVQICDWDWDCCVTEIIFRVWEKVCCKLWKGVILLFWPLFHLHLSVHRSCDCNLLLWSVCLSFYNEARCLFRKCPRNVLTWRCGSKQQEHSVHKQYLKEITVFNSIETRTMS